MEAGTGIEPVFTDLQSNQKYNYFKSLTSERYQDRTGANGERDTSEKRPRTSFSDDVKPSHKRMSRMLGYSLTLGDAEAWAGFSMVARARLTLCERAGLAVAALRSLPDHYALDTAAASLGATGVPRPAFLGGMEDARQWASWAAPDELKAYALACFEAMDPRAQAAFFRHISTVEVAA